MDRKSTDFWHKLNATRQTKCKSITYLAFNLPIVAFTLSGDPFFGTQDMTQHLECKSPVSQLGGIR